MLRLLPRELRGRQLRLDDLGTRAFAEIWPWCTVEREGLRLWWRDDDARPWTQILCWRRRS